MAYLGTNPNNDTYYRGGDNFHDSGDEIHGGYQFQSLEDIINYYMVTYVGEDKIIKRAKRYEVSFHAHRALAELSFDTFKSVKSQEITLPASLIMPLPIDYINYTKLVWSDGSGIEHTIYPSIKTSNPQTILQDSDDGYGIVEDVTYTDSSTTATIASLSESPLDITTV